MNKRQLPPLASLRAFEAAARHLSFERAGEELAVTASAIGQQVKSLEAWLRRPLFVRLPSKGVALTPLGQRYAAGVAQALDQLNEATRHALRSDGSDVLTVSTLPSFALSWLIPRLGSLRDSHPKLELRVSISTGLTDFSREDVDVAIRYGQGVYPGLRSDLLMEESYFPVCSAALMTDPERPLREPADLSHHTLLHEIQEGVAYYATWSEWLKEAHVTGVDANPGPRFSHTFLTLQAAASGQGIALATNVLIGDYLNAGRLVRPFPQEVKGRYQYYVVSPETSAQKPAVAAFRSWIVGEAASMKLAC
jgi:LysR family glycine cleavage system transcriptional activator